MGEYIERVPGVSCPRCGSEDYVHTVTSGKFGSFDLIASEWVCNKCGYHPRMLKTDEGKTLINEHDY